MIKLLFSGNTPTCIWSDIALTVARVLVGLSLAFAHGFVKFPITEGFIGYIGSTGLPMPALLAWVAAFIEAGGGILLALGLLTRPAAAFIALQMLGLVLIVHRNDPFKNAEPAYLFGALALTFLAMGGGRFSLDKLFRRD
ncbi:MAG TPA: DoxX family protein [Turneriella sp.]|nr:DoxX family protein [Turneriella sp.]